MNATAFLDYGLERATKVRARPELFNGGVKTPTPLEAKLQERQRLSTAYKIWKRKERRRILEAEPRLLGFLKFVRKMEANNADELIDAISVCDWLLNADQETRIFALNLIQKRADRINLLLGLPVFSDPMPPATNVYLECRKLLGSRGRL